MAADEGRNTERESVGFRRFLCRVSVANSLNNYFLYFGWNLANSYTGEQLHMSSPIQFKIPTHYERINTDLSIRLPPQTE